MITHLTGLMASWRKPEVGANIAGGFESRRVTNRRLNAERRNFANARRRHKAGANGILPCVCLYAPIQFHKRDQQCLMSIKHR